MYKIMSYYVSKSFLSIIGWSSNIEIEGSCPHKPFVGILSHTSNMDYFLLGLYNYVNPHIFNKKYTVLTPEFKNTILNMFFTSGKYHKENIDYTTILNKIKQGNYNGCILPPKYGSSNLEWNNMYYKLAQELNWDIRVIGMDYTKKKMVISEPIEIKENYENKVKEKMSRIIPLNIENLGVNVERFDFTKHSPVCYTTLLLFLLITITVTFCIITYF